MPSRKKIEEQLTGAIKAAVESEAIPAPGTSGHAEGALGVVKSELEQSKGSTPKWLMVGGTVGVMLGAMVAVALAQPAQDAFTQTVKDTLESSGIPMLGRVGIMVAECMAISYGLKKARDSKYNSTALDVVLALGTKPSPPVSAEKNEGHGI